MSAGAGGYLLGGADKPAAEIDYRAWGSAYTPAVCVSFTVPTLEIGKLLVCLEN
ncbi:hypothetical protein [Mycobacterium sp.]|uniref:hypothetical protein n=1 Tax=Mycobacterium sp. TaxID=1785 RepID=UPI0025FEA8C4|nr:hypothetical protein [Mycobacterium sp.]